jgi:hypothetical protein
LTNAIAASDARCEVGQKRVVRRPRRELEPQRQKGRGADRKGHGVDREDPAGPDCDDQDARHHRPDQEGARLRQADEGVALLEVLGAHYLRNQAGRRGLKERPRGAHDNGHEHEQGHRCAAGQHRDRQHRLRDAANDIGGDHHRSTRQSVRPHPADEQEEDARQ